MVRYDLGKPGPMDDPPKPQKPLVEYVKPDELHKGKQKPGAEPKAKTKARCPQVTDEGVCRPSIDHPRGIYLCFNSNHEGCDIYLRIKNGKEIPP